MRVHQADDGAFARGPVRSSTTTWSTSAKNCAVLQTVAATARVLRKGPSGTRSRRSAQKQGFGAPDGEWVRRRRLRRLAASRRSNDLPSGKEAHRTTVLHRPSEDQLQVARRELPTRKVLTAGGGPRRGEGREIVYDRRRTTTASFESSHPRKVAASGIRSGRTTAITSGTAVLGRRRAHRTPRRAAVPGGQEELFEGSRPNSDSKAIRVASACGAGRGWGDGCIGACCQGERH